MEIQQAIPKDRFASGTFLPLRRVSMLAKLKPFSTTQSHSLAPRHCSFRNNRSVCLSASLAPEAAGHFSAEAQYIRTPSANFASIGRMLTVVHPRRVLTAVFGRNFKAGPVGLLFFLFGIITAALSTLRSMLLQQARDCTRCMGYGIVRCALCAGEGSVTWTAKMSYKDGCPMCMAKRYVDCPECRGLIKRSLFVVPANKPSQDMSFLEKLA